MTTTLPISETIEPADQAELADAVRGCCESETAIYPQGGGTSLDFGLPAKTEGVALSVSGINRVIDYPARDMTITVEAGVTMQALADELAKERQRLPIDVPHADAATLGGVIATNWNGPRRYGQGTVRDHVIGILAVDGTGASFKGGGRVVKNVAGYDFCKLLTGSLGTLGIITQVTLKLKPQPEQLAIVTCQPADLDQAESLLAALVHSATTPSAVELTAGDSWQATALASDALTLAVALEGTEVEVAWMIDQLRSEWREQGVDARTIESDAAAELIRAFAAFTTDESPLVLKANVLPSGTTSFIAACQALDASCNVLAHAGNGVVLVRLSEVPASGLARAHVGQLQAAASAARGNLVILSNPGGSEMTHQSVWGGIDAPFALMTDIKQKFDPKNILNPGRFVYV